MEGWLSPTLRHRIHTANLLGKKLFFSCRHIPARPSAARHGLIGISKQPWYASASLSRCLPVPGVPPRAPPRSDPSRPRRSPPHPAGRTKLAGWLAATLPSPEQTDPCLPHFSPVHPSRHDTAAPACHIGRRLDPRRTTCCSVEMTGVRKRTHTLRIAETRRRRGTNSYTEGKRKGQAGKKAAPLFPGREGWVGTPVRSAAPLGPWLPRHTNRVRCE